jgi:hypothetical protein
MDHLQIQVSVPCLAMKSGGQLATRDLSPDLSGRCKGGCAGMIETTAGECFILYKPVGKSG